MEPFYSALHSLDFIVKQSKEECLAEIESGKKYSFYIKKIVNPLDCQDGDVLCGFYSENEETFNVKIGDITSRNGDYITISHKTNDSMILPFNNSIIPLIKLVYHKVQVDNPNIYGVFACLCQNMRKFLVHNTFYIDDYKYESGMFGIKYDTFFLPKYESFKRTVVMEPLKTKNKSHHQ